MRLRYTKDAQRLDKLHAELLAALPALAPVVGPSGLPEARLGLEGAGLQIVVTVPPDVDPAAVTAVVDAHDPTTPSARELQAAQEGTDLADLRAQVGAMLTRLDEIVAQMGGSPTNAQVVLAVRDLAIGLRRTGRALGVLARRAG